MGLINPDMSGIVDGQVGDAADWKTPMNTIINAINGGIGTANMTAAGTDLGTVAAATAWTTWVPSYSASGSMTFTGVSTGVARYIQLGKTVFFRIEATGTTGGTASTSIQFTLPITAKDTSLSLPCRVNEGSVNLGLAIASTTSVIQIQKADGTNYALAANKFFSLTAVYEAA